MEGAMNRSLQAPSQPDVPTVGKVTHHSIELHWSLPAHDPAAGRLSYSVQEEEVGVGSRGFLDVYNGYSTQHEFTGLKTLTQYQYRLRATNEAGTSPWSPVVLVATTRQPRSCENMHRAILRGDAETVRSILEENPHYIDIPDTYGSSPLMCACRVGQKSIVEVLLEQGASLEYQNGGGKTSLMEGCYHGQLECVALLVERGASWHTRDRSGFSALHWAVDGGHIGVVKYALGEGVPVDDADDSTLSGWTPLMRTGSVEGNVAVARVLIEGGADINRRDNEGKTCLMLAALNGFKELAQLLLESGADPLVRSEHGKTALDFAESFDHEETAKLLHTAAQKHTEYSSQLL